MQVHIVKFRYKMEAYFVHMYIHMLVPVPKTGWVILHIFPYHKTFRHKLYSGEQLEGSQHFGQAFFYVFVMCSLIMKNGSQISTVEEYDKTLDS